MGLNSKTRVLPALPSYASGKISIKSEKAEDLMKIESYIPQDHKDFPWLIENDVNREQRKYLTLLISEMQCYNIY